jgi:hypothetical protein
MATTQGQAANTNAKAARTMTSARIIAFIADASGKPRRTFPSARP